jgi:hypothetical protein
VKQASKHELAGAVRERYLRADRRGKAAILDEFVASTGYHRKAAIRLLRHGPPPKRRGRGGRPRRYSSVVVGALRVAAEVSGRLCGKRLAPFLEELVPALEAERALGLSDEDRAALVAMSPATVDRRLAPYRRQLRPRGWGTTKPGTLLKQQIPVHTYTPWEDERPGFLEIDLVAHCGASGAGEFLLSLSTVDVATGWSACAGVQNKGEYAVFRALERLRDELPFPLLGIDSDNGSEFLNHSLVRWCAAEGITFTRSRPYRKEDTCHVEQKNWSVVRRLVGYGRFEGHALPQLNRVHALARDYVNFLQPVLKLVQKTRDGAKVRKRYDTARTPYRRLLEAGVLCHEARARLAEHHAALHPVRLKLDLEEAQRALYAKAVRSDPYMRQR